MILHDILLKFIPSKEVRVRVNNKIIKINNTPIENSKIVLNIEDKYLSLGQFMFIHSNATLTLLVLGGDIKEFFEEDTNVRNLQFIRNYTLVSISKKDHYVFKNIK